MSFSHEPTNLDQAIALLVAATSSSLGQPGESPEAGNRGNYQAGFRLLNDWGLWHESPLAMWFIDHGIWHPDDMGAIVLETWERQMEGLPWDVDQQLHRYHAFWEKDEPKHKLFVLEEVRSEEGLLRSAVSRYFANKCITDGLVILHKSGRYSLTEAGVALRAKYPALRPLRTSRISKKSKTAGPLPAKNQSDPSERDHSASPESQPAQVDRRGDGHLG